jgi:HSP20 family molecular chaperone IbpA
MLFAEALRSIEDKPLISTRPRDTSSRIVRFCPRYEIHDSVKKFQVCLHVRGFKTKDMTVNIEQGGRNLHVTGERWVEIDMVVSDTRFDKFFALSEDIDTTKITAYLLTEGLLVVEAPKKEKEEEDKTTPIPITDFSCRDEEQ